MTLWIDAARGYFSGMREGLLKREGIRILYYHGVVERKKDPLLERNFNLLSDFQSHVRFFRRFRTLSLQELVYELASGSRNLRSATVITFDDGYANNLLAAEMLSSARLPWALFVSTGSVHYESSTWPVELALLVLHGQASKLIAFGKEWGLQNRNEREATFKAMQLPMKKMQASLRRQALDEIRQQFPLHETERLLKQFPSFKMLSWDEVGELANSGVTVGSHGVHHEIHHPNQPKATCEHELSESKAELEMRLRRSCDFFAFPNGDFTDDSEPRVLSAGYKLGFTTEPRTVVPPVKSLLLPRLYPASEIKHFALDYFWDTAQA